MKLLFSKSDAYLVAFFLAVHCDPVPYTVTDRIDLVLLSLPDDLPPERVYNLAVRIEKLLQIMPGIVRGCRKRFVTRASGPSFRFGSRGGDMSVKQDRACNGL